VDSPQSRTSAPEVHRTGFQAYSHFKDSLVQCIERMAPLEHMGGYPLGELLEKIQSDTLNLVVVGQFKRGKTCLINALVGSDLLPTAIVPLTSIVTILTYAEDVSARVFFQDGTQRAIVLSELAEYVTEPENPKNLKKVKEVLLSLPSPYLKEGVRLVDTPGVGSVYAHNTDVAYRYLPKSDAALFLLSVEQPVSQAEIDFLKDVSQFSHRIFFLLNKIDYVNEQELQQSIAFTSGSLKEFVGLDVRIFPVSAKLALEGKLQGSDDLLRKSRLPEFSEVLSRFLLEEKAKTLLLSVTGNALRILGQARLQNELELKSLTTPLEQLQSKLMELERKKEEILSEERSFDILLEGETDRLVRNRLDEDLLNFKQTFMPHMEQAFDEFCEQHPELSLRALNEALETFVIGEVERAFTEWHGKEEQVLAEAFRALCDRYVVRINQIIDLLLDFSAQLFEIPFTPMQAATLWSEETHFYYKLREEPVGLDLLVSSLTEVFPQYVSNRFQKLKSFLFRQANTRIVKKRRQHMLEAIEMQAGRMRHDFLERAKESRNSFQKAMKEKMRTTMNGISAAIEKGMRQRAAGEQEVAARQRTLAGELRAMDTTRADLSSLSEALHAAR
jgi:GTPase SAR1 family protein